MDVVIHPIFLRTINNIRRQITDDIMDRDENIAIKSSVIPASTETKIFIISIII